MTTFACGHELGEDTHFPIATCVPPARCYFFRARRRFNFKDRMLRVAT